MRLLGSIYAFHRAWSPIKHPGAVDHLHAVAPWGVQVTVDLEARAHLSGPLDGPAYEAIASAMKDAYGAPMTTLGQGGSIPLCNVFADTYPDAELIMIGVEEPSADPCAE